MAKPDAVRAEAEELGLTARSDWRLEVEQVPGGSRAGLHATVATNPEDEPAPEGGADALSEIGRALAELAAGLADQAAR